MMLEGWTLLTSLPSCSLLLGVTPGAPRYSAGVALLRTDAEARASGDGAVLDRVAGDIENDTGLKGDAEAGERSWLAVLWVMCVYIGDCGTIAD